MQIWADEERDSLPGDQVTPADRAAILEDRIARLERIEQATAKRIARLERAFVAGVRPTQGNSTSGAS